MRTIGARAIVGGSLQVVTRVIGMSTAVITVPLLARHLGAGGFGRFTIALNVAFIVIVLAELGLPLLVSRDWPGLSHEERRGWLADFWSVRWVSVVGVSMVAVATVVVLPIEGKAEIMLALALVPIVAVHTAMSALFTAELDPWPVVRGEIANRVLWVMLLVGAVQMGVGLIGVLVAVLVVHVAALATTAVSGVRRGFIRRPQLHLRPRSSVLLRAAGPLALIPLLGAVYARSDVLVLAMRVPDAEVGVYGAIWRIIEAALALAAVGSALLLPKMSRTDDRTAQRRDFTRTLRVLMTVYIPGAVFIAMVAGPLLRLVGGDEFAGTIAARGGSVSPAVTLALMTVVMVFMVFGITTGALMVARHRQGALLRQLVVTVAVNVPLVWAWGARWSILGVALAALAAECVSAVHASWILRQELGPIDVRKILTWPATIALAMAIAMAVAATSSVVAMAVAGVAVAVGLGWLSPARRDLTDVLKQRSPVEVVG